MKILVSMINNFFDYNIFKFKFYSQKKNLFFIKILYSKFFIVNDDSEESDRPKRKKSRSTWDSDNEDSDNSWRQRKKK